MPMAKYELILSESLLQHYGFCLDYAANSVTVQDPEKDFMHEAPPKFFA